MTETGTDDEPRHPAATRQRKDHWPEGIYTISLEGLDHIGVDKNGLLYWDGRLIKTTRKITLDTQERVLAWVVAGATVIAAVATVVQAYVALIGLSK